MCTEIVIAVAAVIQAFFAGFLVLGYVRKQTGIMREQNEINEKQTSIMQEQGRISERQTSLMQEQSMISERQALLTELSFQLSNFGHLNTERVRIEQKLAEADAAQDSILRGTLVNRLVGLEQAISETSMAMDDLYRQISEMKQE